MILIHYFYLPSLHLTYLSNYFFQGLDFCVDYWNASSEII